MVIHREGLNLEEARCELGCSRSTLYKLMREGRLRYVKIGRRTIIPRDEIGRILSVYDTRLIKRLPDAPEAA